MKLKVVAYLIKKGVFEKEALADADKISEGKQFSIPTRGTKKGTFCSFYIEESLSDRQWLKLFLNVDGVRSNILESVSVKGLLFVYIEDRLLVFTFGHGKSMLNLSNIERMFGHYVTLNLGDPERIKSIDKLSIGKIHLNIRTQSLKSTNLNYLKFDSDYDKLKSMHAVVEYDNDKYPEVVSGYDAASINTNVTLDCFPDLAKRFLEAYSGKRYRKKYPTLNFMPVVLDTKLCDTLNKEMYKLIKGEEYDNVFIAPPKIVDNDNLLKYVYKVKDDSSQPHDELDISECIEYIEANLEKKIKIHMLKENSIEVYNVDNVGINTWSIFNCINCEVRIGDIIYILNDGQWNEINTEFSKNLDLFFDELSKNNKITFSPYEKNMTEETYLKFIAKKDKRFSLLDRKLIRHEDAQNKLEFCDLLYQDLPSDCKAFIHVKKYDSSSMLSHLFSQASVAAEFLINNSNSVQEWVNHYLGDEKDLIVNFGSRNSIGNYRIVLAIMQKYKSEPHLPFFSKINIRQHVKILENMGFQVDLAKIDPKRTVFYSFHDEDILQATQVHKMGELNAKSTSKNNWKIEGNKPSSNNEWKKNKSSDEIKERIKKQMDDKSCVVVLIGEHTASCEFVKYAIVEAWNSDKGVVGIHIHNLTDNDKNQAPKIKNPFEEINVDVKERRLQLSDIVKCYNEKKTDIIKGKFPTWIEEAIKIRNEYPKIYRYTKLTEAGKILTLDLFRQKSINIDDFIKNHRFQAINIKHQANQLCEYDWATLKDNLLLISKKGTSEISTFENICYARVG